MSNLKNTFVLSTLASALLAIYGPALAAEDTEIDDLTKPSSEVSVGIGVLMGDDRRQLGIIGGLRDTGGYLLLDADINHRDEESGTWHRLEVANMGLSSREIRAEYEQQGNQGIGVEYRQSLREVPYLVNTGVTGIGTTTQNVPTRCTAPNTPVGCNYTVDSGTNYQLGTERTKFGLDFFKYLTPRMKFKVAASSEDKEGDRHARVGGQPEFAAQPIDWNVRKVDVTLDFVEDKLQMSGGYAGSWFTNDNDLLTANRGGSPFYISQPLDSEAHQLFLNGGYRFTPVTRGTFKLSYTHATQNEHIPTADITNLAWAGDATFPAAPSNLLGEINTTLLELGLTSRPTPKLNVVANLRYHNTEDETPDHLIINTGSDDRTLVHSTPLSYETLTGKLEGTYRLPEKFNLIAGIDYSKQDRTVPFGSDYIGGTNTGTVGDAEPDGFDDQRYVPWRAELKEMTYRIQLRRSMSESINGSLAFLHSKRDGSEYDHAHHAMGHINPINISDRDRNKWRMTLDWNPVDRVGLQFNFEDSQDDYGPSNEYGLNKGQASLYSLDADFAISDKWRINAWYSHDNNEANQLNGRWDRITENHEIDRRANLKDIGDSLGIGLRGQASEKVKVGADLQWTRTKSQFDEKITVIAEGGDPDTGYPNGVAPLEDVKSTVTKISLFAEYAIKKNADLRFEVIHERWESDDWAWNFANGSSFIFNDGTKIITDPKQSSTFAGVRYNFKF
jgi:MtrB/PioB family decaheme-associated outer membrane protein